VAVKRAGVERREAYWSAAARDCGKARGKITAMRQRETHVCSRNASRAPWRKAPERTRRIPCARAVRCARAGIAPTHTLSTASDGSRRRRVVERVSVLQALLARFREKGRALGVRELQTLAVKGNFLSHRERWSAFRPSRECARTSCVPCRLAPNNVSDNFYCYKPAYYILKCRQAQPHRCARVLCLESLLKIHAN